MQCDTFQLINRQIVLPLSYALLYVKYTVLPAKAGIHLCARYNAN